MWIAAGWAGAVVQRLCSGQHTYRGGVRRQIKILAGGPATEEGPAWGGHQQRPIAC